MSEGGITHLRKRVEGNVIGKARQIVYLLVMCANVYY
jgi:hypothetical protein